MDDASLTNTGIVAGTPHYMSPEQADGRTVDQRSDLFSLGAVLYYMATGHSPFRAERAMAVLHRICHDRHRAVREINPEVPAQLATAIDHLLDKRPARRPASAAEVQQTLARLLSDVQQGRLRQPGAWQRLPQRARIAACIAFAGVAIALAIWSQTWFEASSVVAPKGRVRPLAPIHNNNVHTSDAHSGDSFAGYSNMADPISELLSIGPAVEVQYDTEAASLQTELNRLEPGGTDGDVFLQPNSIDWRSESDAVARDLSQLEDLPYPDLMLQGDTR
jgi:serine/threonine protein kinase